MSKQHVDREYQRQLRSAVALMFELADDEFDTVANLSAVSKLGQQTLQRLRSGRTRLPQLYTLVKLGRATGVELNFDRKSIKMRLRRVS